VNNPNDSTTIPNNSIRTLFKDASGKLWIGTAQGLCTYDSTKDQFITLNYKDDGGESLGNNIREIFQGEDQNIYLLSTTMLGKLDTKTDHFEKIFTIGC
jgi:ligand-binding sensor domain-containing protein